MEGTTVHIILEDRKDTRNTVIGVYADYDKAAKYLDEWVQYVGGEKTGWLWVHGKNKNATIRWIISQNLIE